MLNIKYKGVKYIFLLVAHLIYLIVFKKNCRFKIIFIFVCALQAQDCEATTQE